MKGYLSVVSARFRSLLQYRAAAVAGLVTQLFWGLIRVMIFTAFYRASDVSQPMDIDSVVGYVWLGQAFILIQPWGVDRDVRDQIRSGSVAYELLKPLDLYTLWFCRAIAMKTAPTLLRSFPLLAIAALFFGLQPPESLEALAAFSVALTAAVLLSAAITVILNVSLLWTISGDGVSTLVPAFAIILSGMIVPLPLFPDWARQRRSLRWAWSRCWFSWRWRYGSAPCAPGAMQSHRTRHQAPDERHSHGRKPSFSPPAPGSAGG